MLDISLEDLARFIAFDCSGGFKTLSIIVHSLSLMREKDSYCRKTIFQAKREVFFFKKISRLQKFAH